ncbi:MAG: hypothetical protein AAF667_09420 [Pseudomonadota bacterium]
MLIEQGSVPAAALPVSQFRDHLRLGTGFSDDTVQDGLLETCLRAALAAIEQRTGKALIARGFSLSLTAWRDNRCQPIPVAPVQSIDVFSVVDRAGTATAVAATSYRLIAHLNQPHIEALGTVLPVIPSGGAAELLLTAGYGAAWTDVPPDLQRAVLMLSASFYERRHDTGSSGDGLPAAVLALIAPYRALRLTAGAF